MILMLKLVLFAILKEVIIIFIKLLENVNSVKVKEFQNDTIIMLMLYYKNIEINKHVLKTWIID